MASLNSPRNCERQMEPNSAFLHENTSMDRQKINPFVYILDLNLYDKIKVAVLTVTVAPVRLVVALLFLVVAWGLAGIGLHGLTREEVNSKPLTGWRKTLRKVTSYVVRAVFLVAGFHWITVKGRQASAKEAPILVLAPHSSFFDSLPIAFLGGPSVVAKVETERAPFFGRLTNYTQPVYVSREDANSRQNTIREMQRRSAADGAWSQVAIFPEGTCTNRSCLITFKPGAFYPGIPVQPVCIRYPNKLDTVTWTWEGPGSLKLLWLSLCQWHLRLELEFLPVYEPSEEEARNPRTFAANVRQKMADALGLPVTDYSYDDCRLMSKAAQKNLPYERGLVEVQKLRSILGLGLQDVEEEMARYADIVRNEDGLLTLEDFSNYLNIPATEAAVKELFALYDVNGSGKIDFRQYLIGVSLVSRPVNTEEHIQLAFRLFDRHGKGHLTREDLQKILHDALSMTSVETDRLYNQVDVRGKGYVTYDEFKKCAQHKPEYARIFTTYRRRWQQAKAQGDCSAEVANKSKDE